MAFEGLSEKLQGALKKMTGRGKLNEQAVKEGMREVRMALLEADVNYAVAKDFIRKVTDRCVGQEVLSSLSPSQQVQAANSIINSGLSVRQAELLAKRLGAEEKPEKKVIADEVDYTAEAQKDLSSRLGRGVKIVNGRKKGRIELEYYGMDDLNELLEALALLKVRKAQKGSVE